MKIEKKEADTSGKKRGVVVGRVPTTPFAASGFWLTLLPSLPPIPLFPLSRYRLWLARWAEMILGGLIRREELHPLSRAVVDLGDGLLDEIISEVACACTKSENLPPAQAALLEGLLSDGQGPVSDRLRTLTALEHELSEKCETHMRTAMAANGHALAVKHKSSTSELVTCTNCSTQVSAPRFAKHLQDCMLGRGRAASRAANQSLRDQAAREAYV